jgi:hypothetical protein
MPLSKVEFETLQKELNEVAEDKYFRFEDQDFVGTWQEASLSSRTRQVEIKTTACTRQPPLIRPTPLSSTTTSNTPSHQREENCLHREGERPAPSIESDSTFNGEQDLPKS